MVLEIKPVCLKKVGSTQKRWRTRAAGKLVRRSPGKRAKASGEGQQGASGDRAGGTSELVASEQSAKAMAPTAAGDGMGARYLCMTDAESSDGADVLNDGRDDVIGAVETRAVVQ